MSAASLASSSEEQTATTGPRSEEELDLLLSEPSAAALAALERLDSDVVILGVSGKMGPTLARMAVRALDELNSPHRVYGVARFSQPGTRDQLEAWGVQTITCDLLDRSQLSSLPDSDSVIYMAGQKFGTTGSQHMTWGINTYLPALICERYLNARIVAFSTGNVYPWVPVGSGGAGEATALGPPPGEYANSCVGRERMFQFFSARHRTPGRLLRLNYAIDMRYGVLHDVASKVFAGVPIDLAMGHVNVIWQGDANAQAIALLDHCAAPPFVLNVTGPETVSVRRVAQILGGMFGKEPRFSGKEAPTALLNNAAKAAQLFGYPRVSLHQMLQWIADWVQNDGASLDKPTHFETRDGSF
jgi:nucleoside-diphosphate-sugar epimerase